MTQVVAPQSDEVLERHRFYATVATSLSYDAQADDAAILTRNRLHQRVDDVAVSAKQSAEQLAEIKTQARTIAGTAGVLWLVLGGLVGWSTDKTITKLDTYVEIIDKNQRRIETLEKEVLQLQSQKESVEALKRVVTTLQVEIADLNNKTGKH